MHETDALVIGAGPVGLFQVFQLGLLGLKVHAVDALPQAGGQCVALYPDKPIYDVPGVPVCTGRELAALLLRQIEPFVGTGHAAVHLGHLVQSLTPHSDGGFDVSTDQGLAWKTRAVIIAAGAGAFVPKSLGVPALDGASHVHYHLPESPTDAAPWAQQHVLIVGGGEEALSAVAQLAQQTGAHAPSRITLMHRRDQFQVEDAALEAAVHAWISQGRVHWVQGMPQGAQLQGDRAVSLDVLGPDGQTRNVPFDHLLVRHGLSPKLGPLTQWGLNLERKQVPVDTAGFQSQHAGIYAVGDINTYPGKKRLLVCGFHEATMAAHAVLDQVQPNEAHPLMYTTTSTVLKQRLGVV